MGLFSKKNGYETAAMQLEEARDQRRRERSQAPAPQAGSAMPPQNAMPKAPAGTPAKPQAPQTPPEAMKSPTAATYSIDDVIQLMRDLPDSKKEMVILIVQKTLVSAKIDLRMILDKAARKIEMLQGKNDKLKAEIRELEELIIQKKSDVDRLRQDMEETQQVKQSFEGVYLRSQRQPAPSMPVGPRDLGPISEETNATGSMETLDRL